MPVNKEKLAEAALMLAWNYAISEFESRFHIVHRGSGHLDGTASAKRLIRSSLELKQPVLAIEHPAVDVNDLLDAFQELTRNADHELALVASTRTKESREIEGLVVARGDEHTVGIPRSGYEMIASRAQRGHSFRTVFVHNHPHTWVHELLRLVRVDAAGPSTDDREVLLREYGRAAATNGRVMTEFYVFESGDFREFVMPSWARVLELATEMARLVSKFL